MINQTPSKIVVMCNQKEKPERKPDSVFNKESIQEKIANPEYMDYTIKQLASQICHYVY